MKRIFCLIALFYMVVLTAYAEDNAHIRVSVTELPPSFDRSIEVHISKGPSDVGSTVTLSGLNEYTEVVDVPPAEYFVAANVSYDAAKDYPVTANPALVTLDAGQTVEVTLSVSDTSFFEEVTGEPRYYDDVDLVPMPEGYDTSRPAQIGAYLTAPEGFNQTTIVYLTNRYTGKTYELTIYASNQLAALLTDVESGLYTFSGARVAGDSNGRYQITCNEDEMLTEDGVDFNITVIDGDHPERELSTPYQMPVSSPTSTSQPTNEQQKETSAVHNWGWVLWLVLGIITLVALGMTIAKKRRLR